MATETYRAAVVIPTYNRKDYLRAALNSAIAQTVLMELIVLDDGSTDGTPEMVRSEFPQVIFEQHHGPNGPSFLRNRGSRLATAPILFPIDDDATFISPNTVEQTLAEFDHPRIGAVGIPFINVRLDNTVHQRDPKPTGTAVIAAYIGACHALRRDVFLSLGGYREELFYMGEEGDYCIRMLDAGYVVRSGRADMMHHFESPQRSFFRADYYGRRNDVLYAFNNLPFPDLIGHAMATTVNGLKFGISHRRPFRMTRGLVAGWLAVLSQWKKRKPVTRQTYKLIRKLRKAGSIPLNEIEPLLPTRANV